jgi:hypothetical protein
MLCGEEITRNASTGSYQRFLIFAEKLFKMTRYVSSARVFVVHDEHVIASTLAAILRMQGYSATFFASPVEASQCTPFCLKPLKRIDSRGARKLPDLQQWLSLGLDAAGHLWTGD